MSNESSLNDGKCSTDEKAQLVANGSQTNQAAFAPPPPHDPSFTSSSSSNPPSHPEVSVAFQLAQLLSLATQQTSENQAFRAELARLSSENEAHVASLARLSSENAELRKKVETLEKKVEDQDMIIAKVSRVAIPGGYWLWEGGKEQLERSRGGGGVVDGRWLWSLEHYEPQPPRPRTGPPPSLDSLPRELIDIIFSLVGRPEHVALCTVSFKLLQHASGRIYRRTICLSSRAAASFVSSRVGETPSTYPRIRSLLLPTAVALSWSNFNSSDLSSLPSSALHLISIESLLLDTPKFPQIPFSWSRILVLLNPVSVHFGYPGAKGSEELPTVFGVDRAELYFLDSWTRIKRFEGAGPSSIPMILGQGSTFAFSRHLRTVALGGKGKLKIQLVSRFSDTKPSLYVKVAESGVTAQLSVPVPSDPTRKDVRLCFSVRVDAGAGTTR